MTDDKSDAILFLIPVYETFVALFHPQEGLLEPSLYPWDYWISQGFVHVFCLAFTGTPIWRLMSVFSSGRFFSTIYFIILSLFLFSFWNFYEINMCSWGFILYVSTFLSYFLFSFDCMMCVIFLYFSVIFLVSKNNLVSISFLFWREKVIISSQISLGVLSSFLLYQVSCFLCFLCSSWSFSFGFLLFLRYR